jgi:hypothetical protein
LYRIVERTYEDFSVKYILEKKNSDGEWVSVYRSHSLDEIRTAKREREMGGAVSQRVIE